jgi:hypothetical protein
MRPVTVSVTGVNVSVPIPLDYNAELTSVAVGCILSGTATYTVQHTFDDIWAPGWNPSTANWLPNSGLTAKTASADGNYAFPVKCVRLNIASGTGTVTMTVVQSVAPSGS